MYRCMSTDHVMSTDPTTLAKARGVLGHLHLAARRERRPPVNQSDQVFLLELLPCDSMRKVTGPRDTSDEQRGISDEA